MFALQLSLHGNLQALQEYLLTLSKAMEIIGRALKMAKYQNITMQQQQLWQQSLFQDQRTHFKISKITSKLVCNSGQQCGLLYKKVPVLLLVNSVLNVTIDITINNSSQAQYFCEFISADLIGYTIIGLPNKHLKIYFSKISI